jgi:hypothetical protein
LGRSSPAASRKRGFFISSDRVVGSMDGRVKPGHDIWSWLLTAKVQSKAAAQIKALARRHTRAAIKVLAAIMNQSDGPATARVSAAQALLDRGWGKATQPIGGEEGGLAVIARIERVIVDSQKASDKKHSSGEDDRPQT